MEGSAEHASQHKKEDILSPRVKVRKSEAVEEGGECLLTRFGDNEL